MICEKAPEHPSKDCIRCKDFTTCFAVIEQDAKASWMQDFNIDDHEASSVVNLVRTKGNK